MVWFHLVSFDSSILIWFYQVQMHMADFGFILVAFGVVWFCFVWFGFSILIWIWGLPGPPGSPRPLTAPHSFHNPAYHRPWMDKKEKKTRKKTEWDIELLRN